MVEHEDEDRILRGRLQRFEDSIERRYTPKTSGTQRFLGQVYNGGMMPTTTPAVFLTHPVDIDVEDTEGATPTNDVDTDDTVPVLVLGPHAPSVGDILIAFKTGGPWVAEQGKPGCPGGEACYTFTVLDFNGIPLAGVTVSLNKLATQTNLCEPPCTSGDPISAGVTNSLGEVKLCSPLGPGPYCVTATGGPFPNAWYATGAGGCSGFITFYQCLVTMTLQGWCGSTWTCGGTFKVTGTSCTGSVPTTVFNYSGTIDPSGTTVFHVLDPQHCNGCPAGPITYTVTISPTGLPDVTGTFSVGGTSCPVSINFNVVPPTAVMHLTDGVGTIAMAGGSSGPTWTGCHLVSAAPTCAGSPGTTPVSYSVNCDIITSGVWDVQRSWGWNCDCNGVAAYLTPSANQCSPGVPCPALGDCTSFASNAQCAGAFPLNVCDGSGTGNLPNCSSGTQCGAMLPDPVGGGVTISWTF